MIMLCRKLICAEKKALPGRNVGEFCQFLSKKASVRHPFRILQVSEPIFGKGMRRSTFQ